MPLPDREDDWLQQVSSSPEPAAGHLLQLRLVATLKLKTCPGCERVVGTPDGGDCLRPYMAGRIFQTSYLLVLVKTIPVSSYRGVRAHEATCTGLCSPGKGQGAEGAREK